MSSEIERPRSEVFVPGKEYLRQNEIPSIVVSTRTLPEAWEGAVVATVEFGVSMPTEYDQKIDPESRDATVMIVVANPFEEPRIHKAFPDGYAGLWLYVQEVVEGVRDWKVKTGKQSYSYHDRLANWPGIGSWEKMEECVGCEVELPYVDQINGIVQTLAAVPHSRRAQAITWFPPVDAGSPESPCLQRIWCRVVKSVGDLYLLQMNTHWRSRDAFKAALMNMFAITELQRVMAEKISEVSGKRVEVGRYVDISDSCHVYGSYYRKGEVQQFLERIRRSDFSSRVIRSDDPRVQREFRIAEQQLRDEVGRV